MRVKVLKPFVDKHTGEKYQKNQIVEMTEGRYVEIQRTASFNIKVEQVNLEKLTKEELVEYAKKIEIDLNMDMTKKEMIEKINE